jgi:uncharacterized protein (DUF427 family)
MPPKPIPPAPGQESVWDYPRPPRVEPSTKHVRVLFNGVVIADTYHAQRVLETSHPPVYYIPPADIRTEYFKATPRQSFCEFKGGARYYTIAVGDKSAGGKIVENAAWYYPNPERGYESIKNHVAIYPGLVDECTVDGEQVTAQPGDFYGGWITKDIVGPFKGEPGTMGW